LSDVENSIEIDRPVHTDVSLMGKNKLIIQHLKGIGKI